MNEQNESVTDEEIRQVADRYEFPPEFIREMMDKDAEEFPELDQRARLIGVRMLLGTLFHKEEYFSMSDVCHISGESEEDVRKLMGEQGITPMTVSLAPWLKEKEKES